MQPGWGPHWTLLKVTDMSNSNHAGSLLLLLLTRNTSPVLSSQGITTGAVEDTGAVFPGPQQKTKSRPQAPGWHSGWRGDTWDPRERAHVLLMCGLSLPGSISETLPPPSSPLSLLSSASPLTGIDGHSLSPRQCVRGCVGKGYKCPQTLVSLWEESAQVKRRKKAKLCTDITV